MICYSCKIEKDIDEFGWRNKSKGIRQGYCRECKKKYQRKYYHRSKKQYIKTITKNKRQRKKENVAKAREFLLSHPCVDCGNDDIRALHFDHVRGKKRTEVTHMIQKGYSWETIVQEIEKCDVRCANCHMIKTWPQRWFDEI